LTKNTFDKYICLPLARFNEVGTISYGSVWFFRPLRPFHYSRLAKPRKPKRTVCLSFVFRLSLSLCCWTRFQNVRASLSAHAISKRTTDVRLEQTIHTNAYTCQQSRTTGRNGFRTKRAFSNTPCASGRFIFVFRYGTADTRFSRLRISVPPPLPLPSYYKLYVIISRPRRDKYINNNIICNTRVRFNRHVVVVYIIRALSCEIYNIGRIIYTRSYTLYASSYNFFFRPHDDDEDYTHRT